MQMFIEIQLATAMADGVLHKAERQLIEQIGELLGFSRQEIAHLVGLATGAQHQQRPRGMSLKDAYRMLDIDESASDAEVKKAYRRLMSQHHPDKLVSKGLPEEMIRLATEKTQQIRKAYDMIQQQRGQ
jgi:DnaJ like chaperone protein